MQDRDNPANFDGGQRASWGNTSSDYARHRPDPPASFYERLKAFGVGTPDQAILDLGTGTGALALQFARAGCEVTGTDIDPGQIEAAKVRAKSESLEVDFMVSPAEETSKPDGSFDVVTANQCWPYFDLDCALADIRRLLRPGGKLVVSSFSFLPRQSTIVARSEELVCAYNPKWSGRDWDGHIPAAPKWAEGRLRQSGLFIYDEDVGFTRVSWRGRMRALRGMAASMPPEVVEAFDREHAALLEEIAPPRFAVPHRISAYIFEF